MIRNKKVKLLIITQKVDIDDDILGFFHQWIKEMAKHVEEIHVITLYQGSCSLPSNVFLYSLGKERKKRRLYRYAMFYKYLFKILPKVDGIFVHMCPEYLVALFPLNLFFKKRIVWWNAHIHASSVGKLVAPTAYKILSPSKESFNFTTDNFLATGHGIDLDIFYPSTELIYTENKRINILSVSRISYVKNIEALIEAVKILVKQHKFYNFSVTIAGAPARAEDSDYLLNLKKKIKKYNIEKYFQWIGAVSNMETAELYRSADIFVRMQEGGGFGKSELEAIASGVPVIIPTNVYKEIFNEYAGDLIWDVNNIEEFAEKIISVTGWGNVKRQKYRNLAVGFVKENHNLENLAKIITKQFK